jgi:transcriptional regulator with XRE-family HTH domain
MAVRSGLGPGIRQRRRALGIAGKRIADTLGVSIRQLGRWERGEDIPDLDQVEALVGILGPSEADAVAWKSAVAGPEHSTGSIDDPVPPSLKVMSGGLDADPWSVPPERRIAPPRLDRDALVVRREEGRDDRAAAEPEPTAVMPSAGVAPAAERPSRAVHRVPGPPAPGPAIPPAPAGAANTGAVFPVPDTKQGSERVTYQGTGDGPAPDERLTYLARRAATAAVLVALAGLLWWAMGSLGDGLGAILDLLRGGTSPAPDMAGLLVGR